MAIVKTERRPFLDRLQQSVQMGAQVADTINRGRQLDVMQQEVKQKADWFKLQSDQYAANLEAAGAEKRQKAKGFFFGQIANMIDDSADAKDDKERNARYESYLDNSMEEFRRTAAEMGEPMANDPAKFRNFVLKRAAIIGPDLLAVRNTEAALRKTLSAPDKTFNTEQAGSLLESYAKYTRKTAGHLTPHLAQEITSQVGEFQKAIDAKNARVGKAINAEEAAEFKAANRPRRDVFGDTVDKVQGDKYAIALDNIPVIDVRIANIDEALALVDKAYTGPIKGTSVMFFGQKIAAEDAQKLEYFINKEGINAIMDFAQKAGVRAIDTEAERQYLLSAMANKTMSPEVLKMVLKRQQRFLRHVNSVTEAARAHVAVHGNTQTFKPPAFQVEAAAPPAAPSRNKFLVEED